MRTQMRHNDRTLRILLVEDDAHHQATLSSLLKQDGHEVILTRTPNGALTAIDRCAGGTDPIELLVVDLNLGSGTSDGLGLIQTLRDKRHQMPIIVLTGHGRSEFEASIRAGANDLVSKSTDSGTRTAISADVYYEMAHRIAQQQLIVRREQGGTDSPLGPVWVHAGALSLDPNDSLVYFDGKLVENIRPKEFCVLYHIASKINDGASAKDIKRAYDDIIRSEDSVRAHISAINRVLGSKVIARRLVFSKRGLAAYRYKIDVQRLSASSAP